MARPFLILIVGCPSCGALRGAMCKNLGDGAWLFNTVHKARKDAYATYRSVMPVNAKTSRRTK